MSHQFINYYHHHYIDCPENLDGVVWQNVWSCACNDRCPECNAEIEPYFSEKVDCGFAEDGD